jgi:hypothetical protein
MSCANQNLPTVLPRLLVIVAIIFAAFPLTTAQEDESKNAAPQTGAITGRVVSDTGQPIPHATVFVGAPMNQVQSRVSMTDDNGEFQVEGLDASIYTLSASSPGYFLTPRDPEGLPSYYRIGDSVTIPLVKGGVITGTVTSATGEPMVQVLVRLILLRDADGKPPVLGRFTNDRMTDDRGVYRIYGLMPGTYLVTAGGRGAYGYMNNAYDGDAPTYAPSSTRDTAAEFTVRAGEETTADIRYRGEQGHVVSGMVSGPISTNSSTNITLAQVVGGVAIPSAVSFQQFLGKGFSFYGVADGEYELSAQSFFGRGESIGSEPRRITVKGADLSGIEVVVKELASIRGRVVLEPSTANECKNKRQPLFPETVVVARRSSKVTPQEQASVANFFGQGSPDKSGEFTLRNLAPGQFSLRARFFAKYWYLRSIVREAPGAEPARGAAARARIDAARNGISLKFGERVSGVALTLAAGAASLRGTLQPAEGETLPAKMFFDLVPAEKESAEDVLRFFRAPVAADGAFAFNNLPPGRYWALSRIAADSDPQSDAKLRLPEEADTRAKLRRDAEAAKTVIEFKPCQNVTGYQLPFKSGAVVRP